MDWYEWFFLMSKIGCGIAAIAIVEAVWTITRESGPGGEEARWRRLGW
jgi:hypothetical protein